MAVDEFLLTTSFAPALLICMHAAALCWSMTEYSCVVLKAAVFARGQGAIFGCSCQVSCSYEMLALLAKTQSSSSGVRFAALLQARPEPEVGIVPSDMGVPGLS